MEPEESFVNKSVCWVRCITHAACHKGQQNPIQKRGDRTSQAVPGTCWLSVFRGVCRQETEQNACTMHHNIPAFITHIIIPVSKIMNMDNVIIPRCQFRSDFAIKDGLCPNLWKKKCFGFQNYEKGITDLHCVATLQMKNQRTWGWMCLLTLTGQRRWQPRCARKPSAQSCGGAHVLVGLLGHLLLLLFSVVCILSVS